MTGPVDINKVFAKVREALPELTEGTEPLGMGSFGIVVTAPENAVRKIFFQFNCENSPEITDFIQREVDILKQLQNVSLEGIEIPKIMTDPVYMDHADYSAHYTMTRVQGATPKWMPGGDETIKSYREKYEDVGRILAKFHRATEGLDLGENNLDIGPYKCRDEILHPALFSARTHEKMLIADRYLKAHMKSGTIHGDFHMGNVLEQAGKITGLLDFTYAARGLNRMHDALFVPQPFVEDFVKGYERESGEKLGQMIHVSKLAVWSEKLSMMPEDTSARRVFSGEFEELLDGVVLAVT